MFIEITLFSVNCQPKLTQKLFYLGVYCTIWKFYPLLSCQLYLRQVEFTQLFDKGDPGDRQGAQLAPGRREFVRKEAT